MERPGRRRGSRDVSPDPLRVLVAFEDAYRLYRDALAGAIGDLRPHLRVGALSPDGLAAAVARLDPILVISDRPNTVSPNGRPAWYEFRPYPGLPSVLCLDGEYSEVDNPAVEELLSAVDDAEALALTKGRAGGC